MVLAMAWGCHWLIPGCVSMVGRIERVGWGQSPALRGAKIPGVAAYRVLARLLCTGQGGSLTFGAPGCVEQLAKVPSCLRANSIAGALLMRHGASCCTKILEMTEEPRVRCFWSADGLDLPGALQRCSGERVGCWGACPGELPSPVPLPGQAAGRVCWPQGACAAVLGGICCSGSRDFLLAIGNEFALVLVSE